MDSLSECSQMDLKLKQIVNLYQKYTRQLEEDRHIPTDYGRLEHVILKNEREIYVHTPKNVQPSRLIIFLHGSRGSALMHAMYRTQLIRFPEYILIFAQATGVKQEPYIHEHYNHVSFGELYFEIRDTCSGFIKDLNFMNDILRYSHERFPSIDDYYLIGHSNGGVFACLMAVYIGHKFKTIISHMGGIGFDPHFYLDFTKCQIPRPKMTYIINLQLMQMIYFKVKVTIR